MRIDERDLGLRRRHARIAQRRAVVDGGQKSGTVIIDPAMSQRGTNRDEGRQVIVLGPQPVANPRAHARSNERVAAGMQLEQRPAMPGIRAVHAVEKAQVVDALTHMRKQLTHPGSRLAVLPKLPGAGQQVSRIRGHHAGFVERQRLAMIARQERLVVERVDLRRPTVHEQEDDPLGTRREMRRANRQRIGGRSFVTLLRREQRSDPAFPARPAIRSRPRFA